MIEREFSLPAGPESRPAAAPPPRRSAARGKRYGRTGRQRRRRVVFLRVALLLAIVVLLGAAAVFGIRWAIELLGRAAVPSYGTAVYDLSGYRFDPDDPQLFLVNGNIPLPEGYEVQTAQADPTTGVTLETAAAAAYQQMASAALAQGVELSLAAGYRDAAAQQELFNAQLKVYRKKGLPEAEAAANAATIVARPGQSEFATGLLAEILTPDYDRKDTGFADTAAYAWLCRFGPEFGFVQRYPQNSQPITGMVWQPWCWRYVGVENAKAITQSGVSLEEFTALQLAAAN